MKKLAEVFKVRNIITFIFFGLSAVLYYGTLFMLISWCIPVRIGEAYSVIVTDISGKVFSMTIRDQPARYVALAEMPEHLPAAFVAVEDKNFYHHAGIEAGRILQAGLINTLSGRIKQGGSTISQQYARTLYLNNDQSFFRKIKEAMIAMSIEHTYSKEKIIEGYLNSVYLGHNLYGVDAASHYYFGVEVKDLSLAQGAVLTALASSPSMIIPSNDWEKVEEKKRFVLETMYHQQLISASSYHSALTEVLHFTLTDQQVNYANKYYLDAVKEELQAAGILTRENLIKGLHVETVGDYQLINSLQDIINDHSINPNTELALVVMETYTGHVRALIGGKDYQTSQYNRALQARRPIGSTVKPIIYYLGLEKGMSPSTTYVSEPTTYLVKNYGNLELTNPGDLYPYRPINMIEAIGVSDNIYAGKSLLLVGSKQVADALNYFSNQEIPAVPTLALGTAEMSPLELASLYSTFAAEGRYYPPQLISRVYDSSGLLLYQKKSMGKELLNSDSVILLNQMLKAPFDYNLGLGSYTLPTLIKYLPNSNWAAKTGTTAASSWVAAFNPYYTFVVYVGTDDNSPLQDTTLSRQLFLRIANLLSKEKEGAWYAPTNHQYAQRVEPVSLMANSNGSLYYFPKD